MLEVFLSAIALPLREEAEHKLDLTVERCQLASDLHDDLLFELLAIDEIVGGLEEKALGLSGLEVHDVNTDLELAH